MRWTAKSTGDMTLSVVDEAGFKIIGIDMLSYGTMKAGTNGNLLSKAMNDLMVIASFADESLIDREDFFDSEIGISELPWSMVYNEENKKLVIYDAGRKRIAERKYPAKLPASDLNDIVSKIEKGIESINRTMA